jgi:hypothetical protein
VLKVESLARIRNSDIYQIIVPVHVHGKHGLQAMLYSLIPTLNNLSLLKEENTPIAMNTNSFPEIVNFLGV